MAAMITRGIVDFVSRDSRSVRQAKDEYWSARIARLAPDEGLRVADDLRRQVLLLDPTWPSAAERRRDVLAHVRLARRLRRARPIRRG